jgi:tRNA (cytidine32/uridine32-2'-O)-methyltransferase
MTQQLRIVLVNTSHPGNIGAAARAMKTMGLAELVLVAPKSFPSAKASELAAGADDVLYHARVVDDLATAVADCQLVIGASARCREIALPTLAPRQLAAEFSTLPSNARLAIVFGRESTGLSNSELSHCQRQLVIPSHPSYQSLNLAAAVQVVSYECYLARQAKVAEPVASDELATAADVARFHTHLQRVLTRINFYQPDTSKFLMPRLQRLFNRRYLEVTEVNILRGILTAVEKQVK